MRVLVTGASGMLGAATARALAGRGDVVTVMQRRPASLDLAGPGQRVGHAEVLGDVADLVAMRRAAAGQDAVVHLAAKVDVVGPWREYEHANITGTRSVLSACRAEGVGVLVHVSSPSVAHHGSALVGVGAGRADPRRARGGYARSKAVAERDALAADGVDLAVVVVRPHLVWGPGDTQLVARVVARARAGRLPVIGSGAALIDTSYVDNAAAALVAAVDAAPRAHGEALVVSNGEPRPVAEVLAALCRAAGAPGPRGQVPLPVASAAGAVVEAAWAALGRRDTPPITRFLAEQLATAHWFDQRRTRDLLGWAPAVTLDDGFAALARWYATVGAGGSAPRPTVR